MKCGAIVESQLQVLAAIHWTVERINDGRLLPFAKLGICILKSLSIFILTLFFFFFFFFFFAL